VVVTSLRSWHTVWRPHRKLHRFAFLESGEVIRLQNTRRSKTGSDSAITSDDRSFQSGSNSLSAAALARDAKKHRNDSSSRRHKRAGIFHSPRRRKILRRRKGSIEVGSWWFDKVGLRWDVTTKRGLTYQFSAEHHPNVFGSAPTMVRGVITRDRVKVPDEPAGFPALDFDRKKKQLRLPRHCSLPPPHVLRPVVGTFNAVGDSVDTHDPSYSQRTH